MVVAYLLAFLAALYGVLYLVFTWQFDYWRKRGVPHTKPIPFFGNFKEVFQGKMHLFEKLAEGYHNHPKENMVGMWAAHTPVLVLRDPSLIKTILVKDFNYFPNRAFNPHRDVDNLMARALFSLNDDAWRNLRVKLTPIFSSGKLKMAFPLFKECSQTLEEVLKKEIKEGHEYDMKETGSRYTIDVITSIGFGCNGQALTNPSESLTYSIFIEMMNFNYRQGLLLACMFFVPPLYRLLGRFGVSLLTRDRDFALENMVASEAEARVSGGKQRADLFGLMLEERTKERAEGIKNPSFEGSDLTSQSLLFLLAGSETSAATICFACSEMAKKPHLQQRAREDVLNALKKHGDLNYESVNDMPYLDRIVEETLRLWPSLPYLDRVCIKDYRVPGTNLVIEKGTKIFVPLVGLQRDPAHFPDPDEFDPDRWNENSGRANKDAYMPFGIGPRFCIGMRFGQIGVKMALSRILINYDLKKPPMDDINKVKLNHRTVTLVMEEMPLVMKPIQTKYHISQAA